jgi:16S rRNA (cytosine967-C5)-methyltransferase
VNLTLNTRGRAALAVHRVLSRGETLDAALKGARQAWAAAQADASRTDDPRTDAQVQALAYGAIRWHHRHRWLLGQLLNKPLKPREQLMEALLSVGLFELHSGTEPDYAAVSAAVDACRQLGEPGASALVNATLRRAQREAAARNAAAAAEPAISASHPRWLQRQLQQDWPAHWPQILQANQAHPPLWLRVNARHATAADYAARLAAAGIAATGLPALPGALRLDTPVPVEALPDFAAGHVSVQDAASQLAALLLDAKPGERVLDACTAPGGKLAQLLERTDGLHVTALDIDEQRLERVRANLQRLQLTARVTVGDALTPAAWWDGQPFHRILVDAPCSATGVIRRHPDIKLLRRVTDIPGLAARQGEMLRALWPLLAQGGVLLYATCSLLRAENHAVIADFLLQQADAEPQPAPAPAQAALAELAVASDPAESAAGAGATADSPGWQLLPGPGSTDGFYYALMRKRREKPTPP